ncbi:MAG: efflux RND transporter permease subunit [Phycisphaerales bacterium]|nr:efflux RND transporter permease subunit [Phycisphaerales bacterium]
MSETPQHTGFETLFFRNRHLLWLSVVVIFVVGVSAVVSLPRLEDPRITHRDPIVITSVPGASAERVESLVTEVLEEALDEIDEIKDLDSTSRAGVSIISIELDPDVTSRNNEQLFAEIRDKVGEAAALLPPEAGEPIVDDKRDPAAYTLILGVSWDFDGHPQLGLLSRLAEELGDRLRNIDGTELVRVYGAPEEEITVEVDHAELAELGFSADALAALVGQADAKRPAGVLRGAGSDVFIEVEGELDTVRRIGKVPVGTSADDSVLTIDDIARVRRGWRTPESEVALVDGRRSVLVAARVGRDIRVDKWAEEADRVVEDFETNRAEGIRVDRVFEQEPYTTERLGVLAENLLAGSGVILLAVFFIMGLRPAIIVSAALPLVVAMVMFGWQLTGGAIHQMSIYGMIVALGLLIDNAIVMTDEVTAYKARGHAPIDAVAKAVRHFFLPLLASTITTVLAFAPIMLLPGGAGDFVGSIGTSVIMAIIASFFVAMTITATLAGIFTKPTPPHTQRRWYRDGIAPVWLSRIYQKSIRALYAAPVTAIALAAALPLAGFAIAPTLGNQFFPPVDRNMFELRIWMPSDNSIGATTAEAEAVEKTLRSLGGVHHVSWLIGGSYPTVFYNLVMNQDRSPQYAHAIVSTASPEATKRLLDEAQVLLDERHTNAQIVVRQFAQGPPVVADIEYRLFGPSIRKLQELGDALRIALQAHPDVVHTQATMPRGEPKLFFDADEDAAHIAGMTLVEIAVQLEAALEGSASGSIIEDLEQLPVRVRYADSHRRDLDAVASTLLVQPGSDRWTSVASLGDLSLRPELGGITRFDSERTNTIKAYVRNGALPIDVSAEVMASLESASFALPDGYRMEFGGASEQDAEATTNLAMYAPILATLMIATLILAFRSLRYAAILVGVAVFSLGLALLSTWSISFPVSFNTILGTLGLIGVALNDSIVVLAAIRADPRAAAGDRDAIVKAVAGCTRHVIATTATTIGGFLPLLLFVGGDFWPSLAIVLVGGIGGATLIAVLFIPGAYILMRRPVEISDAYAA